ncbi:hypothetical protein CLV47_10273 [Antricoccus suffuscus]|uniref:FhuF-like iron-sulfur protein n=1 Tax=Antricoccus suffuscus TaxID=1629062 RepID=A0A2T1A4F6_9ACTN|nr:hypothetical protein [Antricoccus suffuscus]PRZ43387.1 hypothetical protein CLV47_10273 [Antricoccus suffuscus]
MSAETDCQSPPPNIDTSTLLRAAARAVDGLDLTVESAPRGSTLQSLTDDPAALASVVDLYHEYHLDTFGPDTRRDISALWLLQDIAWLHAIMVIGLIPSAGASLVPSTTAIGMHFPRDFAFSVEVNPGGIGVRRIDPARRYAEPRRALTSLLAPFVSAMAGHLHAGPRAAWACVTDMASSALSTAAQRACLQVTHELQEFSSCPATDADRLLHGLTMRSSPSGPIRRRHGCCLLYAIGGMDVCFSCPRLPDSPAS